MKRINMLSLSLVFAAALSNPHSAAGEDVTIPIDLNLSFKIVTENSQPVMALFDDGREATLKVQELPPISFNIPVQVQFNTCSDQKPKTCVIRGEVQTVTMAFFWTKNPLAPERLNMKLEYTSVDLPPEDLEYVHQWGYENQKFYPSRSPKLKPYEIICDDYRFLTGEAEKKEAPEHLHVIDWSVERMRQNPETRMNENRSIEGTMNAHFVRSPTGSLVMTDIGKIMSNERYTPSLFFGDIIGWTFESAKADDLCEIAFKPYVDAALATFLRAEAQLSEKTPWRPFIISENAELWRQFLLDAQYDDVPTPLSLEAYYPYLGLGLAYVGDTQSDDKGFRLSIYGIEVK